MVGYFVLGPTELFKLTKEIGKFVQNFRTLGTEATKSFESTMENQLELQELRKAQAELNNAFNFRRSINVDQESDAFSEIPPISAPEGAATATATAAAAVDDGTKKKKRRRVKKKRVEEVPPAYSGDIPDLDMSAAFQDEFKEQMGISSAAPKVEETETEMAARLRRERMDRLKEAEARAEASGQKEKSPEGSDWYSASEADIASEVLAQQPSPEEAAAANARFQAQLSGKWNENVIDNEEELSPLGNIMERLSILEEERAATNRRLDEEFARRAEIEEKFYREKREILEVAASEVSAAAYSNFDFGEEKSETEATDDKKQTTKTESKLFTDKDKEGDSKKETATDSKDQGTEKKVIAKAVNGQEEEKKSKA